MVDHGKHSKTRWKAKPKIQQDRQKGAQSESNINKQENVKGGERNRAKLSKGNEYAMLWRAEEDGSVRKTIENSTNDLRTLQYRLKVVNLRNQWKTVAYLKKCQLIRINNKKQADDLFKNTSKLNISRKYLIILLNIWNNNNNRRILKANKSKLQIFSLFIQKCSRKMIYREIYRK